MILLDAAAAGDALALVAHPPGDGRWCSALTYVLFRAGGLDRAPARPYRHRRADAALRHPARRARRCSSCSTACATSACCRPERCCPTIPTRRARLVYLGVLLLFLARLLPLGQRRDRSARTCATSLIWALIFAMVVIAYGFRDRLRDSCCRRRWCRPADTIELRRGSDGHFHADLEVNGAPVRFMVDTGASDIVLSRRDAAQRRHRRRTALALSRPRPDRQRRGRSSRRSVCGGSCTRRSRGHRRPRQRQRGRPRTPRSSAWTSSTASRKIEIAGDRMRLSC